MADTTAFGSFRLCLGDELILLDIDRKLYGVWSVVNLWIVRQEA